MWWSTVELCVCVCVCACARACAALTKLGITPSEELTGQMEEARKAAERSSQRGAYHGHTHIHAHTHAPHTRTHSGGAHRANGGGPQGCRRLEQERCASWTHPHAHTTHTHTHTPQKEKDRVRRMRIKQRPSSHSFQATTTHVVLHQIPMTACVSWPTVSVLTPPLVLHMRHADGHRRWRREAQGPSGV